MNHDGASPQETWISRVVIRLATADDLPDLEWDGELTHFRRVYADAFRRQQAGQSLIWVAVLDGTGLVGPGSLQWICDRPELADGRKRAYLYSFRVKPDYRSQGLGTRVMEVVENDLRARGFGSVTLNVAKDNIDAQRLYARRGYQRVAHEPGCWSYPDENGVWRSVEEPAWRMEKDLRQNSDH